MVGYLGRLQRRIGWALAAPFTQRLAEIERGQHGGRATYVGNNRVLVKCVVRGANIAYFVEADDLLISPWFIITGEYETNVTNFFLRNIRPDSHCIDAGANFGFFTCLMGRFNPQGRVIAVEADRHIYELVRDNIAINGFGHGQAIPAAVGSSDADVQLFRRNGRSANTSVIHVGVDITEQMGERPAEAFTVRGLRIDDLAMQLEGRVDLIKVDVEGYEPPVMTGAARTISTNPQLQIGMEWSPGQIQAAGFDLGDFLRALEQLGLKPHDLEPDRMTRLTFAELINLPYRAGIVLTR